MTFGKLSGLDADHPLLTAFSPLALDRLTSCPDITDDFPAFFFILNGEGQIVCSSKALPDSLWLRKEKFRWAWTGGIFTIESHRGKGLATLLVRESNKVLHQKSIGRGTVFSRDMVLHIYEKLGYSLPGFAARYLMVKSLRPFLEAHIKVKPLVRGLNKLSHPIIRLFFQHWYGRKGSDLPDIGITRLPLHLDITAYDGFPDIYHPTDFHFDQGFLKLVWKVNVSNANRDNDCRIYVLTESGFTQPLGYFVVRFKEQKEPIGGRYNNFKMMTLMDYGLFRNDNKIYWALLKEALKLFWGSDAEVLEIISNSEPFDHIIKRMGFRKIGRGMSYGFSVPSNWNLGTESRELRVWPLTHFCGDAFSF